METQIDTDFELLYPDKYINNISERLRLYNELNELDNEEALNGYEAQLNDRFGPLPEQAKDLLNSVRIKWIAKEMGLEKVVMKKGVMIGYFVGDQQSEFYQSEIFSKILHYVQKHPGRCRIKEKDTRKGLRLLLSFSNINSIEEALKALRPFAGQVEIKQV